MARRDDLLDAAIDLIGEGGIRALTHRAVDAAADLPTGSTSNLFRTREALLVGVVQRFGGRERANWEAIAARRRPSTPAGLARALGDLAVESVTTSRNVTLARYAILVEAANRPAVRNALTAGGQEVLDWATTWMARAGSRQPQRDAATAANWLAGIVLHELANPATTFRPHSELTHLLTTLIDSAPKTRR